MAWRIPRGVAWRSSRSGMALPWRQELAAWRGRALVPAAGRTRGGGALHPCQRPVRGGEAREDPGPQLARSGGDLPGVLVACDETSEPLSVDFILISRCWM